MSGYRFTDMKLEKLNHNQITISSLLHRTRIIDVHGMTLLRTKHFKKKLKYWQKEDLKNVH